MFGNIKFVKNIEISKKEAKDLGIPFTVGDVKYGIDYNNHISIMMSHNYYRDELEYRDGDYHKGQEVVSKYAIFERPTKDIFISSETIYLVDLFRFASKCKHSYTVLQTLDNSGDVNNKLTELSTKIDNLMTMLSEQKINN